MRIWNYKTWTAFCGLLLIIAITLLVLFGDDVRLLSALVLPPLVAALTTSPRRTAGFAASTVAVLVAIGLRDGDLLSTTYTARASIISVVAALTVQVAILRERDLRTRRRLALMNSARLERDAASGLEDDLASLARAAVNDFADWAFLDLQMPDGASQRIVYNKQNREKYAGPQARVEPPAESADVKDDEIRSGPKLVRTIDSQLLDALFESDHRELDQSSLIIAPVNVDDIRATYFLLGPRPHPPWGEAEVTQIDSLARSAALAARTDQLIDRLSFAQGELRASRDQISAIVHGIADGVTAQSVSGELVFANEKAAEMLGFDSAEELIGTHFGDVHPRMELRDEAGNPFDPMDLPSKRAFAGEEEPTALLRYVVKATGREWWTLVKSTAIRDSDGVPTMAITVIEDVTEHRREELAQKFLSEASKRLSESLDFESAVETLAQVAVPRVCDVCLVDLVDNAGDAETVAIADVDANFESFVDSPLRLGVDSPRRAIVDHVLATGTAVCFGDNGVEAPDAFATATFPAIDENSGIVVPIFVRGRPIGTLTMFRRVAAVSYSEFDIETALEFGRRAGITIDNARMHTERMQTLSSLQQSLIPSDLPEFPGVELSAAFRPAEVAAEVGGDFYDAFELPDGELALVVGDVCGKGPRAASVTALARYTIRTAAMTESDPQAIVSTLNRALIEQVGDDRFCTIAFVKLIGVGTEDQRVEVISSGHPTPLLLTQDGPVAIGEVGTLLGVVESPQINLRSAALPAGSAVLLYTDGLSAGQSTDDAAYAVELLRDFRPNGTIDLARSIDEVARSVQPAPNRDDVAVMVAKV
ncbi:MAG: SpoIIE family protein phosphatase [Solirubrobacterales bacterium]